MYGVTLSVYNRHSGDLSEQIHIAAPSLERAIFIAVTIGYTTESQSFMVHEQAGATKYRQFWMCYGPHQQRPSAQRALELIQNRLKELNKGE